MTCAALILAAGASNRLGQPKQLVRVGQETLLERSVRVAREAGCSPVVVVIGAFQEQIQQQCSLRNALVVLHPEWAQGMGSSLAAGMRAVGEAAGVLILTCDMPAVHAGHLRALAATDVVTASAYSGRKGVPAYFPRSVFPDLLALTGDAGARELLRAAAAVELAGGELDVDTPEALRVARAAFP